MKTKLRKLTGALTFAAVVALFGAPSSPVVDPLPTVGGDALAYGPCDLEYMVMQTTEFVHGIVQIAGPVFGSTVLIGHANTAYQQAVLDFVGCTYG